MSFRTNRRGNSKVLFALGIIVAVADVNPQGINCELKIPGDLTDKLYCDQQPAMVEKELGGLDIVVKNAGIIHRGSITESSDEDFILSFSVNVETPFRICQANIPLMAGQRVELLLTFHLVGGFTQGLTIPSTAYRRRLWLQ